jgi:hypothetical protein
VVVVVSPRSSADFPVQMLVDIAGSGLAGAAVGQRGPLPLWSTPACSCAHPGAPASQLRRFCSGRRCGQTGSSK